MRDKILVWVEDGKQRCAHLVINREHQYCCPQSYFTDLNTDHYTTLTLGLALFGIKQDAWNCGQCWRDYYGERETG